MKFAVAYINFYDKELIIDIIDADDWTEALRNHSSIKMQDNSDPKEVERNETYIKELCKNGIEDAKEHAFNGDWLFDVKVI